MVQIKHLTAPQKNAKFSVFKTCKMAVGGQNTRRPQALPGNYFEPKQTYFRYSLDKAFHSPEFQAKAKLRGRFLLRQPLNSCYKPFVFHLCIILYNFLVCNILLKLYVT